MVFKIFRPFFPTIEKPASFYAPYIRIQDARGRWEEYTYTFTWDWYDAFYTSIRLNYGRGDYSYMDNIRLGEGRMECLLDGAAVCFYSY